MEKIILDGIQALRFPLLDGILSVFTNASNNGELFIVLALMLILFSKDKKVKQMGLIALIALAVQGIGINLILKPMIMRTRPFIEYGKDIFIKAPHGSSFPSGHSATAFSFAAVLYYSHYKHFKAALIGAILMGFSRMYFYVHYPSDVLVGALFGWLVGWALVVLWNRYQNRKASIN